MGSANNPPNKEVFMRLKKRIAPSERIRKEIAELMSGKAGAEVDVLGEILHRARELVGQELLEEEAKAYLGRPRYGRREEHGGRAGYRNGYEPARLKTAEGVVELEVPQLRDTEEPYRSRLKEFFRGNTDVLEKLAMEMYVRGLSTRDIEEAFYTATGDRLLSKSSVSRVTEQLWAEYEAFIARDLSIHDVVHVIVDAVYEAIRPYVATKEGILVAYGITSDGGKVLLHVMLGNKESADVCREFFRDMVRRGLSVPLSVTSDGAPGMIKAIEEVFPRSLRIRCWVHKMRNLSVKLPPEYWEAIKPEVVAIRDAVGYEEGLAQLQKVVRKYQRRYPSFIKCLMEDQEALLAVLKVPWRHRRTVRSSNLVERSFVEERRRSKIIPQFLTERSCLKLVFSVLVRASFRWRRITVGELERSRWQELRQELGIAEEAQRQVPVHA
jgi:putative transposase